VKTHFERERTPVPRVSIGLPVYNGASYLEASLQSLLAQSFTDFEIVISDNASTDETAAVCNAYAAADPRIRYIRQPQNGGAAWNFNRVFELSRGEYFKWAAADDVCDGTLVERCVNVLDAEPDIVLCHARTQKIDAAGAPIAGVADPTDGGFPAGWFAGAAGKRRHRPDGSCRSAPRRFADVLLSSGWGVRCSGLFRSHELAKTPLIQPYYGYEKVMMADLALRGRFHDLPEVLFYQRVHAAASSQLQTAHERQRFQSAAKPSKSSPRLRLLGGYLRAIAGGPVSISEKALCYAWLARYLLQLRKWPAVVKSMLPQRSRPAAVPLPLQALEASSTQVHSLAAPGAHE